MKRYVTFLYIFLGFAIGLFCWAVYVYYQESVPSTIRVKAGTREEINLKVPASGVLDVDSQTVIALNQPITIVAGDTFESCKLQLRLFGVLPFKDVEIKVVENTKLIPVGSPIGIYVKTQGALVVDTGSFHSSQGELYAPSEYKLQSGDYLTAMDGVAVTGKKQIREYVEQGGGKEIIFQVTRNEETIQVKIEPKPNENGVYKIGAWLRDSAQGIGTMTYLDEENHFGALGHGINDMDTGELLKLGSGLLYQTQIVAIQRGQRGNPGELTGVIEYQSDKVSGVITQNTGEGIYGIAAPDTILTDTREALPVGLKTEVHVGAAQILCNVDGVSRYYDIEIIRLTPNGENVNRQISLAVTDETLLELTGGIVQGMSGAPIIQDGKLIGAVTHVLVQDAARGYGIYIEDMLGHSYD